MILTVRDEEGSVVRRLTGPVKAGFHRVAWDLRYPPPEPSSLEPFDPSNPFVEPPRGPTVVPGTYTVSLAQHHDGEVTPLGEPRSFDAVPIGTATLPAADKAARRAKAVTPARVAPLARAVAQEPAARPAAVARAARRERRERRAAWARPRAAPLVGSAAAANGALGNGPGARVI